MVTIADVERAASELETGGREPSLRLALWAAILSCQKPLDQNGAQLSALRPYARRALPAYEPHHLAAWIRKRAPGMVTTHNARAIILVAEREEAGELDHLKHMPASGREWLRWRNEVARMFGLSWKTASFGALLMWPHESPFVPVDSHVCARLGLTRIYASGVLSRKGRTGYGVYRSVEQLVRREWMDAGKPCVLAVWHWLKWEEHRQLSGYSRRANGCESHAQLSARVY